MLFVRAPNDDPHRRAFRELTPGASFDAVLQEWRVPWDGGKAAPLIERIQIWASRPPRLPEIDPDRGEAEELPPAVTGLIFGYARVSTAEQSPEMQIDAFRRAGVEDGRIFYEQVSGAKADRPELASCLRALRRGDMLIIWRLDRLGRNLRELLDLTHRLEQMGVHLRSLCEAIDTATPGGRLMFHMMGAIAEFERNLMLERTRAGLAVARSKGRRGGRPAKIQPKQINAARAMIDSPEITAAEVAAHLGVHRSTLYRTLRKAATKEDKDP